MAVDGRGATIDIDLTNPHLLSRTYLLCVSLPKTGHAHTSESAHLQQRRMASTLLPDHHLMSFGRLPMQHP